MKVRLTELFIICVKIGALLLGGGYVIVPLLINEFCEKRNWFAKEEVDAGKDLVQSTLHASRLRFRPILMTSLAFILGMLPMVLASGPGSASRQAIGTGVFFGMIVAVTVGIVLVPFFFIQIYKAKSKFKKNS